jgi:hypothetical protein
LEKRKLIHNFATLFNIIITMSIQSHKIENKQQENAVYDISLDGTVVNALGCNVISNTDGFNFKLPEKYRYTKDKPYIALKSELPTKLSQLTNDKNFITSYTETDPVYTKDKPNLALKSELFKPTTTGEGTKFLADNGDYMPVNVEPPEKGVDYWTEADKTEIKNELKQYVDDELLNGVY